MIVTVMAVSSVVTFSAVLWLYLRERGDARKWRNIAALSVELARKHESLMANAMEAAHVCAVLAERAGADAEVVKYKSMENSLRYAVGMADKIGAVE